MARLSLGFSSALVLAAAEPQFPRFSWNTLPVAWHSALNRNFTSEELHTLARYAAVTLEKSEGQAFLPGNIETCQNGTDLSRCGCCEEDEMVRIGKSLKAVSSEVTVIAYTNSIIAYPWYRAAHVFTEHPDLWLRDANGTILNNIKQNPVETWHVWDHAQQGARDIFTSQCKNMVESGAIDSCFVDGCKNIPQHLAAAKDTEYSAEKPKMLAALQQEVRAPLICGSGGKAWDGMMGTQLQNWGKGATYSTREIPMMQSAMASGIMFEAHGNAVCNHPEDPDHPDVQTELAAFLVSAGEHAYYMCSRWSGTVPTWYSIYDRPLGAPLSDAVLTDGVYTREFASGTKVSYNTTSEQGTIAWASANIMV